MAAAIANLWHLQDAQKGRSQRTQKGELEIFLDDYGGWWTTVGDEPRCAENKPNDLVVESDADRKRVSRLEIKCF